MTPLPRPLTRRLVRTLLLWFIQQPRPLEARVDSRRLSSWLPGRSTPGEVITVIITRFFTV
jgi:hypothetical protein